MSQAWVALSHKCRQSYDSELKISKLNLFDSLVVQGKKELAKYSDLQIFEIE